MREISIRPGLSEESKSLVLLPGETVVVAIFRKGELKACALVEDEDEVHVLSGLGVYTAFSEWAMELKKQKI